MTERKRTPAEMASETLAGNAVFTPPNFGNLKADLAKAWKEALGAPPEWLTPEERDKAVKLVDRALDSWPKNWPDLAWLLMAAAIRPERSAVIKSAYSHRSVKPNCSCKRSRCTSILALTRTSARSFGACEKRSCTRTLHSIGCISNIINFAVCMANRPNSHTTLTCRRGLFLPKMADLSLAMFNARTNRMQRIQHDAASISAADFKNDDLVSASTAASLLRVSGATLIDWRYHSKGPPFYKVGRLVYYRRADLWAWLQGRRVEPKVAA